MFRPQGALASKEEVGVAPGEDGLHGVAGRVPGGRGPRLPARAAEVVVVADETLEPPPPEVALHAGVTGHALVAGHHYQRSESPQTSSEEILQMLGSVRSCKMQSKGL